MQFSYHYCNTPVHRNGLMELVSALNSELINTSMALMEATQILEVISRRNFSAEMMSLEQYESVVGSALALATTLWEVAVQINAEVSHPGDLYDRAKLTPSLDL